MIEFEKTYLAKYLPYDLKDYPFKEIIDIYIPQKSAHPVLRIRKNGDKYEITKKEPLAEDRSEQKEQTIILDKFEFAELEKLPGKKVSKNRYFYEYQGRIAEVDVFKEDLQGLVLVDVEFETAEEKNIFYIPEFCLCDVTQEEFVAGGMLCGKSYSDIENELNKYQYKKL